MREARLAAGRESITISGARLNENEVEQEADCRLKENEIELEREAR